MAWKLPTGAVLRVLAVLAVLLPAGGAGQARAAECGNVSIADMNWSSATFLAHVDAFVLRHGFGCDAVLVHGDTVPTGISMIEKGQPDVAPELWTNSFKTAVERGVAEGRLVLAGAALADGGEEGFWVPQYMVEDKPELATIDGIRANAKLFPHPEDPSVSLFMGCPAGWACQTSAGNLFRALELEAAGFELGDPGSGAALAASLAKAYERREPWFGYYWGPTALLGRYDMVKVDFGTGVDEAHFLECISQETCREPRPTMYPPGPVHTMTTAAFAERAPDAFAYLQARSLSNDFLNRFLAWMDDRQADGEVAMVHFLREHEAVWLPWVDAAAAQGIREALARR